MHYITQTLLFGFLLSLVWFLAGGVLYMNPVVAKIYKKYNDHPSMKRWPTQKKYLFSVYFFAGFIPSLFITAAFIFLSPISSFSFACLLVGVRIIPRLLDMWVQTSYPNKILLIEVINGIILSFVAAYILSWLV